MRGGSLLSALNMRRVCPDRPSSRFRLKVVTVTDIDYCMFDLEIVCVKRFNQSKAGEPKQTRTI